MSDMCDIYISEIKSLLRRADELITQGRTDNTRLLLIITILYSILRKGL